MASCSTMETRQPMKNQQYETSLFLRPFELELLFNAPYFNNTIFFLPYFHKSGFFFFACILWKKNTVNAFALIQKLNLKTSLNFWRKIACAHSINYLHTLFTTKSVNTLCVISLDLIKWKIFIIFALLVSQHLIYKQNNVTYTKTKQTLVSKKFFFSSNCSHSHPNLIDSHIYAIL